jgi:UDP-N-acetylglucosamine--N-acetylmuramyl-(pentapeptide) pyrophosphoryl-undecaprenol N-acetylglucosamine transferase
MVMAGGTGGHVFPALAVAEVLRDRNVVVTWLGTRRGIEAELVPEHGFPIDFIDVEGVRGRGVMKLLKAPFVLMKALWQSIGVIRSQKPEVVLGLGGFASGPGGVAARLLGLPLVIHEQNAVAGTTNTLLAKIANRILEAFPGALPRGEWVGNPVRKAIEDLPALDQDKIADGVSSDLPPIQLLVLGGSLGASAINQQVPKALALLPGEVAIEVRHQCGRAHQSDTESAYEAAGVKASIEPFIADMAEAYEWADVVVCRAGALTVAELTAAGVGALLIPYPHAIDDHQTKNGEWLVEQKAALLMQQSDLTPEKLAAQITEWSTDRTKLQSMAVNARAMAKSGVAESVADICMEVCRGQ